MTLTEKRFLKLWLVLAGISAILFFLPFLLAILILIGIGLLLAYPLLLVPSATAYLGAAMVVYWPVRLLAGRTPHRRVAAALIAAALVLGAGFILPDMLNRRTLAEARSYLKADAGRRPLLTPQSSIALVQETSDPALRCHGDCQRLLYKGLTRRVLVMPHAGLAAARQGRPFRVGVHERVTREEGCGKVMLGADSLTLSEWGPQPMPPRVWDYQDILGDRGECLRSRIGDDPSAASYIVDHWNYDQLSRQPSLLSAPEPTWQRQEVLARRGGVLVSLYRRTQVRGSLLGTPLGIVPPFTFDTSSPAHLATRRSFAFGAEPELNGMLGHLIANDLRLPDLAARVRRLDGSQ